MMRIKYQETNPFPRGAERKLRRQRGGPGALLLLPSREDVEAFGIADYFSAITYSVVRQSSQKMSQAQSPDENAPRCVPLRGADEA
jgi:hypothetical protein